MDHVANGKKGWEIKPCRVCGKTPEKMYGKVFCYDCWDSRRKGGMERGRAARLNKKKQNDRLWNMMNEVWREEKDIRDSDPAKTRLRKLRDDNPSRFVDQMSKLEPKSTDNGVQVVVVHLPVKLPAGSPCPPPAAATKEAVERLVMDLEDKRE